MQRVLKLSDLAYRPDLNLGPLLISPSRRLVEGPAGQAHVEPLVMQAFLLLIDARGSVVTREELFDQCWGEAVVGDDSLNRTIAMVRRIAAQTAPGLFEIETIPRTGYRLTGKILSEADGSSETAADERNSAHPVSRRSLVAGGAAAAAALGAGGVWWATRDQTDPRFDALMERGEDALRLDEPSAVKFFEQAVAIEPRNARSWGLLAYALCSGQDMGPSAVTSSRARAAERAARTALEIDPNEPNALVTMTIVRGATLDWFSREEEYRRLLAIAPDNTLVMRGLRHVLHGAGRCNEALAIVERALAIEPLCPDHQLRKAMQLWVHGRVPEADRVIDRTMELWPAHRLVRMARLMIYAFTGRTAAALAMVEDEQRNPILLSAAAASVWRTSLLALATPTASTIAAARKSNLEGAKATPAVAAWAILVLSALGDLDAAFEVANGFLLGRGALIIQPKPDARLPAVSTWAWRNTHGLYTPPTKPMRLDPRFMPLADGLGLTEYWRKRGIGPDAFLFKA